MLRYYGDLTEAETARLMGCSVGTVKTRASRALTRLREQLPQLDPEQTPGGLLHLRGVLRRHGGCRQPVAMRCDTAGYDGPPVSSVVALGPPGADQVELLGADGIVVTTRPLDDGVVVLPATGSERTAR